LWQTVLQIFFFCLISLSGMGEFKLGADLLKYLTDTNLLLLVPEPAITNSRDSRVSPGFQPPIQGIQGCGGY